MKMYSNVNAPPNLGPNVPPMPNVPPAPTYTAPAFDSCYPFPAYAYCCPPDRSNDFILIVVLFILLIIVGACGYSFC